MKCIMSLRNMYIFVPTLILYSLMNQLHHLALHENIHLTNR